MMNETMHLARIPDDQYTEYRYNVIFQAYKWDPQVEDQSTVANHALLLDPSTAVQLDKWAEQLSEETMLMEESFLQHLPLAKQLGLSKEMRRVLRRLNSYERNKNVRLMRFDFHPTATGWTISEVNSDVPGGLAEASILPEIAGQYFDGYERRWDIADNLLQAFQEKTGLASTIAFVHATSYSDDRQVMQFISDYFSQHGMHCIFTAPDHIRWENGSAFSIVTGQEGSVDGIVRFFPLEWLPTLPKRAQWQEYFSGRTPSCNHPIALFTQSKRLPLVWDELGVDIPAWKKLLPVTKDPKHIDTKSDDWIYKPAWGRVGEGISIREAISPKEFRQIAKAVNRNPIDWVAQKKFESQPLIASDGKPYHVCIGVFTVDGRCAGYYGRISSYARIDAKAQDIPILVAKSKE